MDYHAQTYKRAAAAAAAKAAKAPAGAYWLAAPV